MRSSVINRRRALGLLSMAALGTARLARADERSAVDVSALQAQFRSSGLLTQAAEFTYWLRGGPPGEGYTSDLLALRAADGGIQGEYIRARFDEAYEPPYLAEQFRAPVPLQKADAAVQTALAAGLFSRTFPGEQEPPVADILKETWTLKWAGGELAKTFYQDFPNELNQVRGLCEAIMNELARAATPTILNPRRSQ